MKTRVAINADFIRGNIILEVFPNGDVCEYELDNKGLYGIWEVNFPDNEGVSSSIVEIHPSKYRVQVSGSSNTSRTSNQIKKTAR